MEVEVQPIKERCQCGIDESVRIARIVGFCVTTLFLVFAAGCWMDHYYTTKQIEALPGSYKAEKIPNAERFPQMLGPEYRVIPKPEEPKKEEKK